jgi:hypothetical protein
LNCRHIIVSHLGKQFHTNICMEDAKFHFVLVD